MQHNLTRAEAASRAELLAVQDYRIALDLTVSEQTFTSHTVVQFTCREPGAETFIDLIAPTVERVRLNGNDLDVESVVTEGRIRLPDLAEQNELEVVAQAAFMHTGEGLHRFVDPVDGEVYLYSQFEVADARRVFCCFDQPDLKARYTLSVTAPSSWTVFSASPTPEPTSADEQSNRFDFETTPVMSPYVMSVVAGPYRGVRGELTSRDGRTIPLGVYSRASLLEHLEAEEIMQITRAGFAHYEELFDQSYPFAKYDQIFVPEFNAGAMENAGCVTFTDDYVFRSRASEASIERRALTVLHELAHMWFGDLVTMRWWDDLWLNESFAEYASTRCQVEATRWTTAWTTFLSAEKAWAYRQDQLSSTHPIVAEIRDLADAEVNFDGISYAKGASVLKQLVHWVGKDAFDQGIRTYLRHYAWGNSTLADLLAELSNSSGLDLSPWAAQWLEQAGVNTVRAQLEVDDAGMITEAALLQEAPAEYPILRPHRIGIGGYDLTPAESEGSSDSGQRLERSWYVELGAEGERTELAELVGRARPDLLLINDADLTYTKARLDPASLQTALTHLSAFTDPLASTLVWASAWDMTRDAELSGRRYIDLILAHYPSIDDPSVRQTVLGQLGSTLTFYLAPDHQQPTRSRAMSGLVDLIQQADPGSDSQLVLVRSLAASAHDREHLDLLEGLLSGERELPGLNVDTDLRWSLLTSLVAGGRAGAEQIDSELQRDDTAAGRIRAATAHAAVPSAEAKQSTWDSIMSRTDLPNAMQQALIRGFTRTHDLTLLEPFIEPYFAALTTVWQNRTGEMATQITEGLFPYQIVRQDVLDQAQTWLNRSSGAPAQARMVAEGRDGLIRAIRARACDAAE